MKPQCSIRSIHRRWTIYTAGAAVLALARSYGGIAAWLLTMPVSQRWYIGLCPSIAAVVGRGDVLADVSPPTTRRVPTRVTLYVAFGCPYGPVMRRRLERLRETMKFELGAVDVTFRRRLRAMKGLHAVPAVEVADEVMVGCATSAELAQFIADYAFRSTRRFGARLRT